MIQKISVFFICKNEADRIKKAIEAVKNFADEILVIDSGSTDETCKIAAQLGAKVLFNNWQGYGQQKIFGENTCKNDWVLNLDADEEVSTELAEEISSIFSQEISESVAGFRIKIVNKFRFEDKPKKLAYYYNQLRLYRKSIAGFKNSSVHDSVILKDSSKNSENKPQIRQMKEIIYHQSFRSYGHWIEKINFYSQMQADEAFSKNKKSSSTKIFLAPILAFFKAYFLRRYWIYGIDGLIYSAIFAFSRFAKAIKLREVSQTEAKESS